MNNGGHLTVQYNLRLSSELKDKISKSAKELNRSMNSDIVARIEESFEQRGFDNLEDAPLESLLAAVMKKLGKKSLSLNRDEIESKHWSDQQ